MTELSRSEFESTSGTIVLEGKTKTGEYLAVKRSGHDYVVYYQDPKTGDTLFTKFDEAWAEMAGGQAELFVAGKLKGLRELNNEELKSEVEKRFSNMKEEFPKLYSEALPVAKLFQKTGEIFIPSPLNKHGIPSMDSKTLYRTN